MNTSLGYLAIAAELPSKSLYFETRDLNYSRKCNGSQSDKEFSILRKDLDRARQNLTNILRLNYELEGRFRTSLEAQKKLSSELFSIYAKYRSAETDFEISRARETELKSQLEAGKLREMSLLARVKLQDLDRLNHNSLLARQNTSFTTSILNNFELLHIIPSKIMNRSAETRVRHFNHSN